MASSGHAVQTEPPKANGSVAAEATTAPSSTPSSSNTAPPPTSPPPSSDNSSMPSFPQLFVPVSGPVTAAEYAKMVSDWQVAYSAWLQASCAHYGALISGAVAAPLQAAFQVNSLATFAQANARPQRAHASTVQIATIPRASYSIPSLWKRVAAECIDMIFLFFLRTVVTLILFRNGFFRNGDRAVTMEKIFSILAADFLGGDEDEDEFLANFATNNANTAHDNLESTLDDLLQITSQLVIVECIALLFYTIYEVCSLCRSIGARRVGGATLGKKLMKLKVVQHDISRMRAGTLPNTIIVSNVHTLTFWRATLRSVIKNFSASVMFPASLTVFFYSHRLAVYDILAASTVVEAPSERELTNDHVD